MMTKKILMGLGLCSLLALPATNALAESGFCSNVQVVQAGSSAALGKIVKLRNTDKVCGGWVAGTDLYFILADGPQANGMLAAALSAQAAGGKVMIVPQNGDAGFTNYGTLAGVYTDAP